MIRRGPRGCAFWALVVCVALVCVARTAAAVAPVVVIVEPAAPDQMVVEALTRIRGELIAAGCEIATVEGADQAMSPATRVEIAATVLGAIAAFEIVHDAAHPIAEVWIADRLTGKPVVRRIDVPAQSGRAISTSAVQAVELLRASLLQRLVSMAASLSNESKERPIEVPPTSRADRPRIGVELGSAFVDSTLGDRGEWAAVGRLAFRPIDAVAVRASFVGFGSGRWIGTQAGAASLRQELVLFDARASLSFGAFRPGVSLGAGGHHLSVQGVPALGYLAKTTGYWGFAADAGIGASIAFSKRWSASFETHVAMVFPSPLVQLGGVDVTRVAAPAVVSSLTIGGWL